MERQMAAKAPCGDGSPAAKQSRSARAPVHPVLALQQTIGNQAVQRLIQSHQIQTKLKISQPGDQYEQEADRVADTVMRMSEPAPSDEEKTTVQTKPLATQITPLVQQKSELPPEEMLEEKKEEVVAPKPLLQRAPVAVREDDDEAEKRVLPKLEPAAVPQENQEEKSVRAKPEAKTVIQRLAEEDAEKQEETLQTAPLIQRQVKEEDEEELQTTLSPQLSRSPYISRFPASTVEGTIQRLCTECEGEKQKEAEQSGEMGHRKPATDQPNDDDVEGQRIQPKGGQHPTHNVTNPVAANIQALNGGGSPLPESTRAFFEPRFGADFGQVRVHTDSRATETANAIN